MYKKILVLIIAMLIGSYFLYTFIENKNVKQKEEEIVNMFDEIEEPSVKEVEIIDDTSINVVEEVFNVEEVKINDNELEEYEGYIEIKSLNIKKPITNGTDKDVMDRNVVGIHKAGVGLEEVGNIILAGHNNNKVFGNLKNIKIGDEIIIKTKQNKYVFDVTQKYVIEPDNFELFKYQNDKKIVKIITCSNRGKQRLIVEGELK